MTRLFLECTVRAALIVAGTAIVLYAMRVKVASVKHRVWTAVVPLMLALPFWIVWGPKAPVRILPAGVQNFAADVFIQSPARVAVKEQKADSGQTIAAPARRFFSTTEEVLLGLYLFGALILIARLAIGTVKASRLIRESVLVDGIMTSGGCAAPVTVGCLRPTVILPLHWREWTRRQLDVVLAHEGEHVRRRDPLVQWLALLNRAIFWFHPAAWWLERELSALAEECCDAAVIAQGHDPREYAETLMKIARDVMDSGSRINSVAVAMPGVRLPERVRKIVEGGASVGRVSRVRAGSCFAASLALWAAFVAVTLTKAQSAALAWEKAAGGKMKFDVASVKEDKAAPSADTVHFNVPITTWDFPIGAPTGGLYSATNLPVAVYLGFAYKIQGYALDDIERQLQAAGFSSKRYDIEARAAGNPTRDQYRLMMQSLLADRFKLAMHWEIKQMPVMALVIAKPGKLGPQLRAHLDVPPCPDSPDVVIPQIVPSIAGGFPLECGVIAHDRTKVATGNTRYFARNVSMASLATTLSYTSTSRDAGKPVVDETSLTGNYDFVFEYTPDNSSQPQPDAISLTGALKDDLGLKLVPANAGVDVLVLDHIEEPTAN